MVCDKNTQLDSRQSFYMGLEAIAAGAETGEVPFEGLGQPQPILTVQDGNTSNILVNMNTRKGHDILTWALLSRLGTSAEQVPKKEKLQLLSLTTTNDPECPNLVLLARIPFGVLPLQHTFVFQSKYHLWNIYVKLVTWGQFIMFSSTPKNLSEAVRNEFSWNTPHNRVKVVRARGNSMLNLHYLFRSF